jgi:hypothetical protein
MTSPQKAGPSVALIPRAHAYGSSCSEIIQLLRGAGITVTGVQNPVISLADDVARTRRVLAQQPGPVILAAHSFAGTVITEPGTQPAVAALVYVAARAPDWCEDCEALAGGFPVPPASAGLICTDGFGALTEDAFLNDFANGVEPRLARVLCAVQGPVSDTLFARPDDGSGLAVTAGAVRGLPACRISRPGMAIRRRRKVAIMALPRHTPCPATSSPASPILVMPAHQARRKTWREAVELNRARLKEPAMSAANNESSGARDRCPAQCHAPPAVTTGSPGISVSKQELSSQLVSAEVVLPDPENSPLAGTKIAGK